MNTGLETHEALSYTYTPFDPAVEVLCYVKKDRPGATSPFSPLRYPGVITNASHALGIEVTYEEVIQSVKRVRVGYFPSHKLERRRATTNLERNQIKRYTAASPLK